MQLNALRVRTSQNMKISKAILLVGGKGTRLAPLTDSTPKPMLKVAGKPVTEHQIVKAREAGIREIVLATSYMADVFEPYFGDGSNLGMSITYAVEETPLGTGGAIANAARLLSLQEDESVLIFNGDVLSAHDLNSQIELHLQSRADVTLYLTEVEDARAYGCVPLDDQGRVLEFLEKMENPKARTINAGCYIFHSRAISQIPSQTVVSVERDTFPKLLEEDFSIFGYCDKNYWIDMGTPQSFLKASRDLIMNPQLSKATDVTHDESIIDMRAVIHESAKVGGGSVISEGATIGPDALIMGSMIMEGVTVGDGASIINSYISKGISVPSLTTLNGEILG
jgi:mannose-1-phosphate guanylyltransferase